MNTMVTSKKSLIIIGASGVGKGTIIKNLKQRHKGLFELVLSFTTRPIRPKQVHGRDYYFVTKAQFDERIQFMLEHKFVHRNWYGTSKEHLQQLLKLNKIPILDVDIEGMLEIRQKIPCEVLCLMPAGWGLLRQRLEGRKTESQQVIDNRMKENVYQIEKMMKLEGTPGIHYITNYQYQLTTYGIEKWLSKHFERYAQSQNQNKVDNIQLKGNVLSI